MTQYYLDTLPHGSRWGPRVASRLSSDFQFVIPPKPYPPIPCDDAFERRKKRVAAAAACGCGGCAVIANLYAASSQFHPSPHGCRIASVAPVALVDSVKPLYSEIKRSVYCCCYRKVGAVAALLLAAAAAVVASIFGCCCPTIPRGLELKGAKSR